MINFVSVDSMSLETLDAALEWLYNGDMIRRDNWELKDEYLIGRILIFCNEEDHIAFKLRFGL